MREEVRIGRENLKDYGERGWENREAIARWTDKSTQDGRISGSQ